MASIAINEPSSFLRLGILDSRGTNMICEPRSDHSKSRPAHLNYKPDHICILPAPNTMVGKERLCITAWNSVFKNELCAARRSRRGTQKLFLVLEKLHLVLFQRVLLLVRRRLPATRSSDSRTASIFCGNHRRQRIYFDIVDSPGYA